MPGKNVCTIVSYTDNGIHLPKHGLSDQKNMKYANPLSGDQDSMKIKSPMKPNIHIEK